ncbi:hypothetical protein DL96DRAFT_1821623 [Flagelloscypha sp. PMI_526]|nr:hypothetical protein DL96DRAFT_1821623 [Flagelloscypha sp. PMI_526]
MSLPELSLDILDKIIQFVSDKGTLLSCALASSFLRASSQRVLFSNASIYEQDQPTDVSNRWKLLNDALSTSSDLGRYVQSLALQSVLLHEETTLSVLSKLPNLLSLEICEKDRWDGPSPMPWPKLQPDTRRLLLENVFPHLTDLRFGALRDIPAIIFVHLPSLQYLQCSDCILPLTTDISTENNIHPRPLTHLEIHSCSRGPASQTIAPLVEYLIRYQCQLKELELNISWLDTSMSDLARLIGPCQTFLQSLSSCGLEKILYSLHDGALYNLCYYGLPEKERILQHFAMILQSGKPTPTYHGLRTINIIVEITFFDICEPPSWHPITEALTTITTLEKVCFTLSLWRADGKKPEVGDEIEFSKSLPWLQGLWDALNHGGLVDKSEIRYKALSLIAI